jgi:MFS family permease
LSGYTVAVSGVLTVGVGALIGSQLTDTSPAWMFALLLAGAASLWLLAAVLMWRVRGAASDSETSDSAFGKIWNRLRLLRQDSQLRRFLIVRGLLISTALAAPYYVIIAREAGAGRALGVFVIASGLASALGSAFWGRFADSSSRKVWLIAGTSASGLGVLFFFVVRSGQFSGHLNYLAPAAFFLLAIAHGGVRVGRKTYIVDLADEDNRIDYVAVSNTIIGGLVLLSGVLGLLTPFVGAAGMLLLLSLMGLAGVAVGLWLPEAE